MCKDKVKWREVEGFFEKRGYYIYPVGKRKAIAAPKRSPGHLRDTVIIAYECCRVGGAEVTRPYLELIERVFGFTPEQIKAG